jgi:hypothetical protein
VVSVNRKDALAVLKKIMASCSSFDAKAVNISQDSEKGSWFLDVVWTPLPEEREVVNKILDDYALEAVTAGEHTFFRSKNSVSPPLQRYTYSSRFCNIPR